MLKEMLGVVIDGKTGEPECKTVPAVNLSGSPGCARIRVLLAGICATDLALLKGYKNAPTDMVLGHEFVGIIDEICPMADSHDNFGFVAGDRVCAEVNCTQPGLCGDWKQRAQHPERTALGIVGSNGAFAEFVKVPLENLHSVPREVTDEMAVFIEPLAAACQVLEENHIRSSEKVAVLGAGRLGTLVAGVLAASLKNVTVLVRNSTDENLAVPIHVSAITTRHIPVKNSVTEPENEYDCVVDCSGSPSGLQRSLKLVKPRGTIILKSTYAVGSPGSDAVDLAELVVKEVKVVGSRCGPFRVALRLLAEGIITPKNLIPAQYSLEESKRAFAHAAKPGAMKILLKP